MAADQLLLFVAAGLLSIGSGLRLALSDHAPR